MSYPWVHLSLPPAMQHALDLMRASGRDECLDLNALRVIDELHVGASGLLRPLAEPPKFGAQLTPMRASQVEADALLVRIG